MVLSILQTKDQKKLSKTPIGLIKSMIETFSIQEEKFINEVYYLSLNVSFNKKKILNLMEKKNIFPSLPVEKKIFFLPIIVDKNKDEISIFSENYIYNNWNSNNQKYHLLISKFKEITGCPLLVNTSFNVRGEPIVCTPTDAFKCFMGTQLDALVIGNYFLIKEDQKIELIEKYKEKYTLD